MFFNTMNVCAYYQGSHTAMKSGMIAAEELFAALGADQVRSTLSLLLDT